jgi:hypothetical protein
MARWSVDQVLALAPDESSRRAARRLARPGPWSELGSNESLVWGKCQGSGKAPYQVTVDLTEPAFRCGCPSRKVPCKHGVALLLLWAAGKGSVADVAVAAPFAGEWADERAARAGRAAARAGKAGKAGKTLIAGPDADPEAAAKRAAQREATMAAGLASFEVWLMDLVRQGLGAARRQPYRYWDDAAARLVDAQVPALADRVRAAAGITQRSGDWAPLLLTELGRWFAAVSAWGRRSALPEPVRADLLTFLGVPRRREEVAATGGVRDRWHVLGVRLGGDDRIRSQRTWLAGETSGELVLLLDFAAAGATLHVPGVVGTVVDATVARYPGRPPRRGLFTGDQRVVADTAEILAPTGVAGALDRMASWLAGNPWLDRVPAALVGTPVVAGDRTWLVDDAGEALPMSDDMDRWLLLAVTGGRRTTVFGELEAGELYGATVTVDGTLVSL